MPPTVPSIVAAWFRIGNFTFADFSTGSDSNSLGVYVIPPKGVIHGFILTPTQQFAGALLTSYAIQIGLLGDTARYQSPVDLLNTVPGNAVQIVTAPLLDQVNHVATSSIYLTALSQGTLLDGATAGAFYVDVYISVTP